MPKIHLLLIPFLILNFISAKAQETEYEDPKGIYIQPIYTLDGIATNFLDPEEDAFFF